MGRIRYMPSSSSISIEKLRQIPYFSKLTDLSRSITSLCFFVGGDWHSWMITGNGEVVKMKSEPVEGNYFGDKAERETDRRFLLMEFLAQHLMFPTIHRPFNGIWNDFQSLVLCHS